MAWPKPNTELNAGKTSPRPWYADGLAFECTGCGQCCSGPEEGYVWVSPAEIQAIAEYLKLTSDQVIQRYTRQVGRRVSLIEKEGADCVFLNEATDGMRACAIYPVRPVQCRTWPFWPTNLRSPRAWSLAHGRCSGINRGRRHDLEHIENAAARTR